MDPKFMKLPRAVLVGTRSTENVVELLEELKMDGSALVVADPTTAEVAGKRVMDLLKGRCGEALEIIKAPTMEDVKKVEKRIETDGIEFVLAVGGGRVIDVTKLASKNKGKEWISVPTAAAHDGIASSRASIKRDGSSVSMGADAPVGILADTKIIKDAPYRLLASGCGDIVAKYTSVKDWELGRDKKNEEFSEYAAALSMMSAKIIMDSPESILPESEESTKRVVKALISCGVAMSIAGSSRPASGSEHKFSHALDVISSSPALHGEQCGVGSIMMMHLHGGDWKRIRDALRTIGAPTTAEELGIEDGHIIEALLRAKNIRPERYTILDRVKLSHKDAKNLAEETGVIG